MRLRNLKEDTHGLIDIMVGVTIGTVFAALMIVAYIIWTFNRIITPSAPAAGTGVSSLAYNASFRMITQSLNNITGGFDQTVKIIIIAVLVSVLAVALSYLMLLRSG